MSCLNNCQCDICCDETPVCCPTCYSTPTDDGCTRGITSLTCTKYNGENIPCLEIEGGVTTGDDAILAIGEAICNLQTGSGDKFVKVSSSDTTSGYLSDKIKKKTGTHLLITKKNSGLNEYLELEVDTASILSSIPIAADKFVKITSADTTQGYLFDKAKGSTYILVSKENTGGNENLKFDLDFDAIEEALNIVPDSFKFKISSTDTTPDFFTEKIYADEDTGILLTKTNPGGDEKITLALNINVLSDLLNLDNINTILSVTSPNSTVNISQSGDASHTVELDVNISSVSGNQLISNSGLYVASAPQTPITTGDSDTIDLTASGINNHDLTASVKFSALETNAASNNGGVYVPKIVANDSSTIDFGQSGPANNIITAVVKFNSSGDNALVNNGGLFVQNKTASNGLNENIPNVYKLGGLLTEDTILSGNHLVRISDGLFQVDKSVGIGSSPNEAFRLTVSNLDNSKPIAAFISHKITNNNLDDILGIVNELSLVGGAFTKNNPRLHAGSFNVLYLQQTGDQQIAGGQSAGLIGSLVGSISNGSTYITDMLTAIQSTISFTDDGIYQKIAAFYVTSPDSASYNGRPLFTGVIQDYYGIYIEPSDGRVVLNNRITNKHGIYQSGVNDVNQFNANTGIGGSPEIGFKTKVTGNLKVTGKYVSTPQPLVYGATTIWDMNNGENASLTLSGNTNLAINNAVAGSYGIIEITQGGTGSYTLTLPTGSTVGGNGAGVIQLTPTVGAVDILGFYFNGTSFRWRKDMNHT